MESTDITFKEAFFGVSISGGAYLAFIVFTLISMLLVKLIRYQIKKKKHPEIQFSITYALKDNLLDFTAAFISAFLCFRFLPDIGAKIGQIFNMNLLSEQMAYAVVLGIGFQYIWHKILNNVSVDLKR